MSRVQCRKQRARLHGPGLARLSGYSAVGRVLGLQAWGGTAWGQQAEGPGQGAGERGACV